MYPVKSVMSVGRQDMAAELLRPSTGMVVYESQVWGTGQQMCLRGLQVAESGRPSAWHVLCHASSFNEMEGFGDPEQHDVLFVDDDGPLSFWPKNLDEPLSVLYNRAKLALRQSRGWPWCQAFCHA